MKSRSALISEARILLKDEVGTTQDFSDAECDSHLSRVLSEISDYRPAEEVETMTTTSGSYELDVSDIENLLEVEKVEYPVDNNPPDYRNCTRFGDTLRIPIEGDGENIYLYCLKTHTVTESTSTLNTRLERLAIDGLAAYLALSWVNAIRPRIEQAVADLAAGRLLVNKINYSGNPDGDYGNLAQRELSISASLINTYQNWGLTKLNLYKQDLMKITRPRVKKLYPEG